MRTQKIYLETSIFNFVYADDAPDKKADTLKLFEEIKQRKYEAVTSKYVLDEIEKASEEKRKKMLLLIKQFNVQLLASNNEITNLAEKYVSEGIIPRKYIEDALHIAAASVHRIDIIASWNFKHIVKMKTITYTEIINLKEGYSKIKIHSPTEVIEND